MKLRNKKTGEIGDLLPYGCEDGKIWVWIDNMSRPEYRYNSLAKLNEEWEDYEEPKGKALYWMILTLENFIENEPNDEWVDLEDCKKMLEKLKAWQRLKDKGFEFEKWCTWEKVTGLACFDKGVAHSYYAGFTFRSEDRLEKDEQVKAALDLLFGGVK